MTSSTNDSVHTLSGAYVVDALDDAERAAFEAHLPGCDDCRAEVASLREAAALMADDAAVTPPASLRASVLSGISTIRPLPPMVEQPPAEQPEVEQPAHATVVPMRRRHRFRIAALAAAAAELAVVGIGSVVQPWRDSNPPAAVPSTADRVINASDVQKASMGFVDHSRATVYRSKSQGKAVIVTQKMAAPPTGKVYELWLQDSTGHMTSAGLMDGGGNRTVVLDGDASTATGIGITVEPTGGSDQPTSAPLALFELDKASA
jgi:anti-sigma-K factor RskA